MPHDAGNRSGSVGTVTSLWRFPVKSMGGEQVDEVEVTAGGFVGDRAFALIDAQTGRVVSAKSVKTFPGVLNCRAGYVEEPRAGRALPAVRITLPGGQAVTSGSADADRALSAHFGREVRLEREAPRDFTIDMYLPDIEGADGAGRRDVTAPQKLGAALFAELGRPSPIAAGAFYDTFPVSVMTTSTLQRLAELQPSTRWDLRRFRMNVILGTGGAGFPENDWVGRGVALGDAVRLKVTAPDVRCVMPTLAQGDLPQDVDVMRALVRHNRVQVGPGRMLPCAGVYAVVETPGTLRTGDRAALT